MRQSRILPLIASLSLIFISECKSNEAPSAEPVYKVSDSGYIDQETSPLNTEIVFSGRRYAIIIDGDKDSSSSQIHEENARNAMKLLLARRFNLIYVLAASLTEGTSPDNVKPLKAGLGEVKKAFKELKMLLKANDQLLIYVTGHGDFNPRSDQAMIALEDGDLLEGEFAQLINDLPAGQQTIIMDQCYGGSMARSLKSDRRLIIANTAEEDLSTCKVFAEAFWAETVRDINGDRANNLFERFEAAIGNQENQSGYYGFVFSMGRNYRDIGFGEKGIRSPYAAEIAQVEKLDNFEALLAKYEMGITVVDFFAEWCGPCKRFSPEYESLSRRYAGQAQFLRVNIEKARDIADRYKVEALPHIMIFQGPFLVGEIIGADIENLDKKLAFVIQDANIYNSIEQIERNLASSLPEVRIRALIALRSNVHNGMALVNGQKYLSDKDSRVCLEAARLLRGLDYSEIIKYDRHRLIEKLLKKLEASDIQMRLSIAKILPRIGLQNADIVPELRMAAIEKILITISDEESDVPSILAESLEQLLSSSQISPEKKTGLIKELIGKYKVRDALSRKGAVLISYYIPIADIPCEIKNWSAQKVIDALKAETIDDIGWALTYNLGNYAYSNINQKIKGQIVTALINQMNRPRLRYVTCVALRKFAESNIPMSIKVKIAHSMMRGLRDTAARVKAAALITIGELLNAGLPFEEQLKLIEPVMRTQNEENNDVKEMAEMTLRYFFPCESSAEKYYRFYERFLYGPEPESRARGITIIGGLSKYVPAWIKPLILIDLERGMKDSNNLVRIEVIMALKKYLLAEIPEELKTKVANMIIEALSDNNNGVRSATILILGDLAGSDLDVQYKNLIVEKLFTLLSDEDCGVRRDAMIALQEFFESDISQQWKTAIENTGILNYDL